MKFIPDTFYEMTHCRTNNTEYFYCSPRGDMLPFLETSCLFTAYRFDRFGHFKERLYGNIRESERMQMCWVYDTDFGQMDALIYLPSDLPGMEEYYRRQSDSSPLLHTLSELHAFMIDNRLDYLEIPQLGFIMNDGAFFPREYSPVYKLVSKDFFDDPEICRLYGITGEDVISYFLSGSFRPWEKLPQDHCFYRYGSHMFYVSTREELTNGNAEPCWFKWEQEYNCYMMVSSPGVVMPSKVELVTDEPNVGCIYDCSQDILDVALWEGKPGDNVCSLGEALVHVMDDGGEDVIPLGDWEFLLGYKDGKIHYNGPWIYYSDDETRWPFAELASRMLLE